MPAETDGTASIDDVITTIDIHDVACDELRAVERQKCRCGAHVVDADETSRRRALELEEGGFRLTSARRALTAARVVLTTGGQSYPGSGTSGDGYALTARFGHTIVQPRPALVPITVTAPWVAELRGVTGARALLRRNSDRVVRVPMPSAVVDVDTPEDLLALQAPR